MENMPQCFLANFGKSEPSIARAATWSSYKHHSSTVKVLISITHQCTTLVWYSRSFTSPLYVGVGKGLTETPTYNGKVKGQLRQTTISYLSDPWGGRVSYKCLTECCGI